MTEFPPVREQPEWIGATPDTPVPARVKIRVFERYGGVCYLSKRRIRAGEPWDVEHIIAIGCGGENRERNLAPALVEPHREKTARDIKTKAKIARVKAKHLGIYPKPKGNARLRSRPFNKRVMT